MSCREDDKKCAIIGKYHEEKIEQPIVSIPYKLLSTTSTGIEKEPIPVSIFIII